MAYNNIHRFPLQEYRSIHLGRCRLSGNTCAALTLSWLCCLAVFPEWPAVRLQSKTSTDYRVAGVRPLDEHAGSIHAVLRITMALSVPARRHEKARYGGAERAC
jgi:hypothetical protein